MFGCFRGKKVAGDDEISLFQSLPLLLKRDESQQNELRKRAAGYLYENYSQFCEIVRRGIYIYIYIFILYNSRLHAGS